MPIDINHPRPHTLMVTVATHPRSSPKRIEFEREEEAARRRSCTSSAFIPFPICDAFMEFVATKLAVAMPMNENIWKTELKMAVLGPRAAS